MNPTEPDDIDRATIDDLSDEGRALQRAKQSRQRQGMKKGRNGLVIVNTGKGKGKTTAALGLLMRAWGRDLRVVMLQFIKNSNANFGEERAARKMGVEIIPLGDGFTWMSKDIEKDSEMARQGWTLCRERIESGQYDIVIMDEITYCFKFGWLDLNEVLEVLRRRDPNLHVVMTGRDAPEALIEFADLVTEMREVKHPFRQQGIKAQAGIEF